MIQTTLHELGEGGLIRLIRERFRPARPLTVGIGDDGAVYETLGRQQVAVADAMIEGVHFDTTYCPPEAIGRKLVAVNVSDIAAMGALPDTLLFTASLPGGLSCDWVRQLLDGVAYEAQLAGASIVGGDVTGSQAGIALSITALGWLAGDRPILRSGARPGDQVYVTGPLGGAAFGLELLRSGRATTDTADAVERFLTPRPHTASGATLGAWGHCHAMMDLSDGLTIDAARLAAASSVDLVLDVARIPIHPEVRRLAQNPLALTLAGGEDYELLFSCRRLPPLAFTPIGRVVEGTGTLRWEKRGQPIEAPTDPSYRHF